MQPGQESLQVIRGRVAQRLAGNGLHRRQRVLDAMLAFVEQQFLRVFSPHPLNAKAKLTGDRDGKLDAGFCENCPSSGALRQFEVFSKGGSGSVEVSA
jgi:hypothetical protein